MIRLEKRIKQYYQHKHQLNMTESKHKNPVPKRKRDSSTDTDELCFSPPGMVSVETDLLKLINDKLGILELVSKI